MMKSQKLKVKFFLNQEKNGVRIYGEVHDGAREIVGLRAYISGYKAEMYEDCKAMLPFPGEIWHCYLDKKRLDAKRPFVLITLGRPFEGYEYLTNADQYIEVMFTKHDQLKWKGRCVGHEFQQNLTCLIAGMHKRDYNGKKPDYNFQTWICKVVAKPEPGKNTLHSVLVHLIEPSRKRVFIAEDKNRFCTNGLYPLTAVWAEGLKKLGPYDYIEEEDLKIPDMLEKTLKRLNARYERECLLLQKRMGKLIPAEPQYSSRTIETESDVIYSDIRLLPDGRLVEMWSYRVDYINSLSLCEKTICDTVAEPVADFFNHDVWFSVIDYDHTINQLGRPNKIRPADSYYVFKWKDDADNELSGIVHPEILAQAGYDLLVQGWEIYKNTLIAHVVCEDFGELSRVAVASGEEIKKYHLKPAEIMPIFDVFSELDQEILLQKARELVEPLCEKQGLTYRFEEFARDLRDKFLFDSERLFSSVDNMEVVFEDAKYYLQISCFRIELPGEPLHAEDARRTALQIQLKAMRKAYYKLVVSLETLEGIYSKERDTRIYVPLEENQQESLVNLYADTYYEDYRGRCEDEMFSIICDVQHKLESTDPDILLTKVQERIAKVQKRLAEIKELYEKSSHQDPFIQSKISQVETALVHANHHITYLNPERARSYLSGLNLIDIKNKVQRHANFFVPNTGDIAVKLDGIGQTMPLQIPAEPALPVLNNSIRTSFVSEDQKHVKSTCCGCFVKVPGKHKQAYNDDHKSLTIEFTCPKCGREGTYTKKAKPLKKSKVKVKLGKLQAGLTAGKNWA